MSGSDGLSVRDDVLVEYLSRAPFPLAVERCIECEILARQAFRRPVLDVGCGEGLFAKVFFTEPVDRGVDPSASELERARQLGAYHALTCCGGAELPFDDDLFPTAMSNSVLEHIPDLGPVLDEVRRVVTPGGSFYVTLPTDRFEQYTVTARLLAACGLAGLEQRYRRRFNAFWRHFHAYAPETWRSLFVDHGWEVVETVEYGSPRICTWNAALTPLCLPSFVVKKLTNRWFLLAPVRRVVAGLLAGPARRMARSAPPAKGAGGLVFFHLRKPSATSQG